MLLPLAGVLLFGQDQKSNSQEPPEEDETLQQQVYSFNPIQAAKDMDVGDQYLKKHNYKAAASRFLEATKWNPKLADAFLRLGEAREKMRDKAGAKEAYAKYLAMAPDTKEAETVRKKLGRK